MSEILANLNKSADDFDKTFGQTGKTAISLGSTWKEAIVHVYYGGYCDSFPLLNHSDFNGTYTLGYYKASNNFWLCLVKYTHSAHTIEILGSEFAGQEVSASTTIRVHIKH